MIFDAIQSSKETDQDTVQDTVQGNDHVQRLISVMGQREYSLTELMSLLDLSHRPTFQQNYLNPAIEVGMIERTIPDKPKSPKQKYRLRTR
jgi:hypothetical protein